MIPLCFDASMTKNVNYALVGLNAQKRVLKVKRANPDLDIFGKIPFYPFCVSGIYSRLLSGDVTEYGVNVAKITRMSNCTLRQNWGKIRQIKTKQLSRLKSLSFVNVND